MSVETLGRIIELDSLITISSVHDYELSDPEDLEDERLHATQMAALLKTLPREERQTAERILQHIRSAKQAADFYEEENRRLQRLANQLREKPRQWRWQNLFKLASNGFRQPARS